jgi:hypothetical protein
MVPPTLFDDYPNEDIGHHPAHALGLASAAYARYGHPPPLFCPSSYIGGNERLYYVTHHPCEGPLPYTPQASRANVRAAHELSERSSADFVFNLFLDENFGSFEDLDTTIPWVHALHRPGPRPRGPQSGRPDLRWLSIRSRDLIVVHTRAGARHAAEIAPRNRILRAGWPTSFRGDVISRFAAPAPNPSNPHVLVVGGARLDKGIRCLLAAAEDSIEVRVLGEQAPGLRGQLEAEFPLANVRWDITWASKTKLDAGISAASACVYPYLGEFGRHGGASGALAQALTHPVPLIVSKELADQVPVSDACLVVATDDSAALRRAIRRVLRASDALRATALGHRDFALREHTYEGHLERVVDRVGD